MENLLNKLFQLYYGGRGTVPSFIFDGDIPSPVP